MNEAKHTPGPWVVPAANLFRVFAVNEVGQPYRCIVEDTMPENACWGALDLAWPDTDGIGYEGAANAKLIAAAPDLLAACQTAMAFVGTWQHGFEEAFVGQMRAAIAKATGVACDQPG